MSDRTPIERQAMADFGIGPKDVAQVICAEVTAWRKALEDETDPGRLSMRTEAIHAVADALGVQFAGLNPYFDHGGFMRACGFDQS